MVSVLSVSAFAEFGSTDSTNLSSIKNNTTYGGKSVARLLSDIYIKCDTYFPSLGQIEVATRSTASDTLDIKNALTFDNKGIAELLSSINNRIYSGNNSISNWTELVNDKLKSSGPINTTLTQTKGLLVSKNSSGADVSIADWVSLINGKLTTNGNSAADLLTSIDARLTHDNKNNATILDDIKNNVFANKHGVAWWASDISAFLHAEKQKQDDALDDYSSSGGRSASNTSNDVGAISGSLSNSFNSGVSASSALNAVEDNESDFEYFFFGMHDDLNTSSSGGSRSPARGSMSVDTGSEVPDFLFDYWGGLNG